MAGKAKSNFFLRTGTKALKEAKIDQGVNKRVNVCNGFSVTKHWPFNAEADSLTIDTLSCRALIVNILISLALPIKGISQASANADWHGSCATAFASAWMMNRARLFDKFAFDIFGKERTGVLAACMLNDGGGAISVSKLEWHGEASSTDR